MRSGIKLVVGSLLVAGAVVVPTTSAFAADQPPVVTTTGGTTNYIGGASATTIDSGVTVSDVDNTTQSSAAVAITTGFHFGDSLEFTYDGSTMGNISASYNSVTGVLTLTSAGATATNAQWANAFDAVTFRSTSTSYGNRTISFLVSDGTSNSAAATDTVDVVNPSPMITTDSGSASFVAADNAPQTPVTIDSGLTISDPAGPTLQSATVSITGNFASGEDILGFTNDGATMGNINGSYNTATGVLTLTSAGATATLAQWQAALDEITFNANVVTPSNATRTISFSATDTGSNTSNTATRTVTVTDTDQTPIVTTTGGATNYVEGTSATAIDSGVTVSDLDNTTQSSAAVSITTGFHSGDSLEFTNDGSTMGNISASYDSATGVLTLASAGATATDAQWANAFAAVTFGTNSATLGNRTVSFMVDDGTKTSAPATDTVDVLAPVVSSSPVVQPPAAHGISRIAGADRIATSIDASQRAFPTGTATPARAVVLVGENDAIDGLTGAPLAAAAHAPLLFVGTDSAPANVVAEIHRLLGSSGKVYLLGGTTVIAASVETQLQADGYTTQRIAGGDRYETAVAIAGEIGTLSGVPRAVFEATGLDDADAITAAPAAAGVGGVVLLTAGDQQSAATTAWLAAHPSLLRYAVGGPAAAADRSATAVSGADRYATAADVAARFFPTASAVALASGQAWPDAAVAAAASALSGTPLLLVNAGGLPSVAASWLEAEASELTSVTAYGGTTRIGSTVLSSVVAITGLPLA